VTLTPGSRIGHYEVVAQIGQGGMGVVYRATDTTLKRAGALEVLPAALNHPNIAAIHGLEDGGSRQAG
jgi:serine/threonine protein kinase